MFSVALVLHFSFANDFGDLVLTLICSATVSVRMLEKYSATSKFSASTQSQFYANGQAVSESSEEEEANHARRKRLKTEDS